MTTPHETLGDRIRARRAERQQLITAVTDELKTHIDEHFAKLHVRLDQLDNQQP